MAAASRPTARMLAFDVLQQVARRADLADDVLHQSLTAAALEPRERALAVELVYGVLRRRLTLDWRLDHVADRPIAKLPLAIQTALRVGAYQLLYLDRIPPSAAVNESVQLAKGRHAHWTGFTNAVLRALLRRPAPPEPDTIADPVLALSVRFACPEWLVRRWIVEHGVDGAARLCQKTLDVPPVTVRVNTLRTTRDRLKATCEAAGVAGQDTTISPVGLMLEKPGDITHLPYFEEGGFYVEDEAAQLVPPLLDPQPGDRILDACAAPGGKATHVAALTGDRTEIVAIDVSKRRLASLMENCQRLGVSSVHVAEGDAATIGARSAPCLTEPFDRILVDAPCSGMGVLRRHPEAKWRLDERLFQRQQARQLAILGNVARLLRPGGIIVYSTCSTEPEENEHVIAQFCHASPGWSIEHVAPWLPLSGRDLVTADGHLSTMFASPPMDGFFAARLRKAT